MISYPLEAGGIVTRVLEAGTGAPVVFVHGAGGRADRWLSSLAACSAAGYRAVALDLPGHGFAAKGAGVPCTVPASARLLGSLLDRLGAGRAALVGTSLGAHVAAMYAARNPGRVAAVMLVGALGLVPIGAEARSRIAAHLTDQSREAVATKLGRLIADPALLAPDLIEEDHRINNSPGAKESLATLARYVEERLDADVVGSELAATGLPVLLLWGEQDRSVEVSVGEAAARLLRGSRLIKLRDSGHAPYLDNPDRFNRALLEFLATSFTSTQSGNPWPSSASSPR